MPFDRYVNCPNLECSFHSAPIRLLIARPEQIADDPKTWPADDTYLYLACPECRLVSVHCHAYVVDFPQDARSERKEWIRVSFLCAEEGCNSPAEFHVLTEKDEDKNITSQVTAKLRAGSWRGELPCGHPIQPMEDDRFSLDRPVGLLRGYNLDNPNPRPQRNY